MALEYEWTFSQFEIAPVKNGLENVVVTIHWRLNAADGEFSDSSYGSVTIPEPVKKGFISYDKITKEMAIEWVSSALDVESIQSNLALRIEEMKHPAVITITPPFMMVPEAIVITPEPIVDPTPTEEQQ